MELNFLLIMMVGKIMLCFASILKLTNYYTIANKRQLKNKKLHYFNVVKSMPGRPIVKNLTKKNY